MSIIALSESDRINRQADILIEQIVRELIVDFGKTEDSARKMVEASKVRESLLTDELGFHESPHHWALIILTDHHDRETLEKYYNREIN